MATRKYYDRITLSKRLLMSAELVTKGNRVADIGCDHAHTDIWLIKHEISPYCIAMDLRSGPIKQAEKNIGLFGCSEQIETRLSDGLQKLAPGEVETILIAGMGGTLMREILSAAPATVSAASELILQPQSYPDKVRGYLYQIGWQIVDENMCFEDGKFYTVMKAVKKADNDVISKGLAENDPLAMEFGRILLERMPEVMRDYLKMRREKAEILRSRLDSSNTENSKQRRAEFEKEYELILKAEKFL